MPVTRPSNPLALFILSLLLFCALALVPCAAQAVSPRYFVYNQPELQEKNGILNARMRIEIDNEEGLRDLIKAGSSVELKVDLLVERPKFLLPNAEINYQSYSFTLRHDPLSREFTMALPGEVYPSLRDKNLGRLLESTWKTLELPVATTQKLRAEGDGKTLEVVFLLSLQYIELPSWLDKNMVIWSKDVVAPESFRCEYTPDYKTPENSGKQ